MVKTLSAASLAAVLCLQPMESWATKPSSPAAANPPKAPSQDQVQIPETPIDPAAYAQKSAAFVADAAKAKGAVRLDSGAVLTILKKGKGPTPLEGDTLQLKYRGALMDGKQIDASDGEGEQASHLRIHSALPCLREPLLKMRAGGKAKVVCPASLGYGMEGMGAIPAGAALVYNLELVEIIGNPVPTQKR